VSGHIKWTDVRRTLPMDLELWRDIQRYRPGVMRETQSWVKGYIKALEDVIKDLEHLDTRDVTEAWQQIEKTLASAQETLSTINKIMEEGDGEAVQAPAHETEAP